MNNSIEVDSLSPDSYVVIRDYLYNQLKPVIESKEVIIFLCIGNDRSTGDSLGPIIGHKLKLLKKANIYIYGSLDSPIHSENISSILSNINSNFNNPYIITINASLGTFQNVGKVLIAKKPLSTKSFVTKQIPPVGNISITGIVNISGNLDFMILQNTRLSTVMSLADCIYNGIHHFFLKSFGISSLDLTIDSN